VQIPSTIFPFLEKSHIFWYILDSPKIKSFGIEEKMKKVLLISFLLFFFTTSFAGISTEKKDTLKLIGTSYSLNGNFAWIELNGEDYGWNREGENVGKYRIVMVEMGKVIVESNRETIVLVMLKDTQFENKL